MKELGTGGGKIKIDSKRGKDELLASAWPRHWLFPDVQR